MAQVVWLNEALDQLDLIVAYLEAFDPEAAARIAQRLVDLGESLRDFPRRGRPAADGTRELVTVPPYILSYDVNGDIVSIVGIRHGARNLDSRPQ
ncbi:toxin ParE1/3/4 [Sphingomonas sp. SORGH_AS 950]|uniref:type II toxin-antitoxin system RelE/ParE family toxin n=1 Tax=unclassified Sphingomonas TaxID=196159 RepID=UPI002785316E|nr:MULTISPECIES: type II toxin-antitoxin system RelE/ParE family toxin [unclassified Sphingomonas]MDQ1157326.1 toxin ParE1/3/4 [Sphingomonas sp. SORGH_AS_0950]MDR6114789.1 toxin ParE1/3/4 [Sphingomonas sp. SORGH_AS_0789]MDR6147744.1 toxin ParE1/3/4 [Sphingomonas sp. SORGH_AS_0870]MDR6151538.1 toxin ParE1/3/4 [Sphingomonas sp. SORGH_AS_0742]